MRWMRKHKSTSTYSLIVLQQELLVVVFNTLCPIDIINISKLYMEYIHIKNKWCVTYLLFSLLISWQNCNWSHELSISFSLSYHFLFLLGYASPQAPTHIHVDYIGHFMTSLPQTRNNQFTFGILLWLEASNFPTYINS